MNTTADLHHHGGHGHDHHHHDNHEDHHDHEHGGGLAAKILHSFTPHSHDHLEQTDLDTTFDEASRIGIRAAWISLIGMGITAIVQLIIVYLSGSVALLADTIHTLGHLATTIPLIIAFHISRRPATRNYTYGFGRAEDLVGLVIGAAIAVSVAIILWESLIALSHPRDLSHSWWVIAAAIVGAIGNEAVAMYRIRAGKRIGSAALVAEGYHARADALTSLAVILGVLGSMAGLHWIDPLIGLFIAFAITAVLYSSMRTVLRRLMDGVEDSVLDNIDRALHSFAPGLKVNSIRARWSGHQLLADIELPCDTPANTVMLSDHLYRTVPHLFEVRISKDLPHV
ncbi:cation diffusion facilitator family transporter [Corynebacterium callunae]|uniref:cation diffusion facilitator family transporter n=1 Tax=Corynebacterium callunae TaxID=1721 RepID=UPI003981DDBC